MRKDVKLGFAIGGVLLAVLIVYVLVVPGGGDKRVASATGEASQTDNGSGVSLEPVAPTSPATQPSGGASATAAGTGTPPPAAPATFTPPAGGTDPFEQPEPVAGNAKAKDVDWSKLLNDSQMLMVQTPSKVPDVSTPPPSASNETKTPVTEVADITKPGPTPVAPPPAPAPTAEQSAPPPPPPPAAPTENAQANNTGAAAGDTTNVIADPPTPPPVTTDGGPVTAGDAGGQKIHVVQPGESFSTISMIAYGNPNLYAAIMRANPGVDPQKIRPGMKINIPPASEAMPAPKPAAPAAPVAPVATPPAPRIGNGDAAQVARAEQPIDPQTQYRVQPGDNLYNISKKLYGRGDRHTRIFEANKGLLGDENSLKPGQVLTLPEPPTAK